MELKRNKISCYIFISSEDDKYNVLGGIGTYIGLFSREIKRLFPEIGVYWITKSVNKEEFEEITPEGVVKYYLNDNFENTKLPFLKLIQKNDQKIINYLNLNNKICKKILKLCDQYKGKNIIIETGEWEGWGNDIYRCINKNNILKVVRLHTPLATCIKQNKLEKNQANSVQLLNEYMAISNSDYISACTTYVKNNTINDVVGKKYFSKTRNSVLPNPIDTKLFKPNITSRINSIKLINKILKKDFITKDTFNIYIIGSVENRKGAKLVIKAIPKIITKINNARFCFIGHCGRDEDINLNANTKLSPKKLLDLIPKKYHHCVAFTNYVNHKILPRVLISGDLFPIMSIGDNFPGTVAEISLTEKPIIALSRGGVREMLDDHGKFAAYNLGSSLNTASDKLAKGAIRLFNDGKKRLIMGKKLRKIIFHKYNSDKIVKKILLCYIKELLRKNKNLKEDI